MSSLLVKYNKGLEAKRAIQQVRNFKHPPRDEVIQQLIALSMLVVNGFKLEEFPDADASIPVVGKWVKKQYLDLYKCEGDQKTIDNILDPVEPQQEPELRKMLGYDAKFAEMLASAINKWIKNADTYETARKQSALLQLKNADVPDDEINALINNPAELRKFIQESKKQLETTLAKANAKVNAKNPMDMPTLKEKLLVEKHKSWFNVADAGEDNPYPNDNAVVYSFLIIEIFQLLVANKVDATFDLWKAYESFCHVFSSAAKNDSNTKAWTNLGTCEDFKSNGINVGKAMREYVTDKKRCAKSAKSTLSPQLQSGLQRGPRRLDRIVSISIVTESPFTILNLDNDQFIKQLILLYKREALAKIAVAAAKTIKKGAEGLSDAESMAWVSCLGRQSLLPIILGRNDCSLPKLVGSLVNVDVSAYADLKARSWSVTVKGS